jgi:hypothetical protein
VATERNPYEATSSGTSMDIQMSNDGDASIQVDTDGGVIVEFMNEEGDNPTVDYSDKEGFYRNLVSELEEEAVEEIADIVIESYEADVASREEWEQMFANGLDLLGLKLEETDEPFAGACTAAHPLLIESAVSFQSKAIREIFPAGGPVKSQIIGKATAAKEAQSKRIEEGMNYQLTEEMPEYFDETERLLFHLPLFGSGFKKNYFDGGLNRPVNEFVPIDQFVVSNYAQNLRNSDRYTQILYRSPIQLEREISSGLYEESETLDDKPSVPTVRPLGEKMNQVMGVSPSSDDFDGAYTLLEQHCYLEIEGMEDDTNLTLPYIVTVEYNTKAVLSIRRNYDEDDPMRHKKLFFTHYRFVPAFGFYGIGYIHMLGNLTSTATAAMRSLIDSGQFATLPAGFKAKGVRVTGDNDPIAPGEFKEVEATGVDLTKAIVPLPYKEPSQTLFNMLQFVTATGQKFADNTEQVLNDSASYGPVGTTMALLEASSKFFSAVHKRLHQAQRDELKIIARINHEAMKDGYYKLEVDGEPLMTAEDFDGRIDIVPVSDPNIPSSAHRMMMAQMAMQMSQQAPAGMYNMEELHKTILHAANIPNLDKILPEKPEPQPLDPVSDIMAATKGMPIRAFAGQDHESHIQVKMAYLQDPKNGANPIMQRIVPILSSNIQEHSVMQYQEQMNGVTKEMVQGQQGVSPEVIERAMAQAAQKVLQANQQPPQPTPEQQMVMMEAKRIEQGDKELEFKAAKEQVVSALKSRELDLKERQQLIDAYIEGAENMMKIEEGDKDRQMKQANEALKVLSDLAKHDSDINLEKGKEVFGLIKANLTNESKTSKKGDN